MSNVSYSVPFLDYACQIGDIKTIKEFLSSEDSLNTKLYKPYPMFFRAAKNGHLEIIKLLLDSSFSKNYRRYEDIKDYMQEAIQKGHLDIVQYLWEVPEFKEEKDDAKCSRVVLFSAGSGQLEILKYALNEFKNDPMVNKFLEQGGVIEAACEEGALDVVKFLLDLPIQRKNNGLTSFFESAYKYDRVEVLQYFIIDLNIEKSADIIKIIAKKPNSIVEKLFETRDLKESLHVELSSSNDNSTIKKLKV